MNRIELIRALRQEAGISGSGPVSSAGATGQTKDLVDRIDEAWLDIQNMTMWNWMWEEATVTIPAGADVSAATGVPAPRYVVTSMRSPSGRMRYLAHRDFADMFDVLLPGVGEPTIWTVRPDTLIKVNALAPAGGLTLQVERYRNPVPFAADTDVPALPSQYHRIIVWLAMMRISAFDEAGSRYASAEREYNRLLARLTSEEMPQLDTGEPLA